MADERELLEHATDAELVQQLEDWAKLFDALMRPGFANERAALLREAAARIRTGKQRKEDLDLWSSRIQAASEDVSTLTEHLDEVRTENERLRIELRLARAGEQVALGRCESLRIALQTIAHARDGVGLHLHELLHADEEQLVLEALDDANAGLDVRNVDP